MKPSNSKGIVKPTARLFVGTTEQIAKLTPLKGLQKPIILTDVYSGGFALLAAKEAKEKLGIIEVSLEALLPDNLAPWNGAGTWKDSLRQRGACFYLQNIPPVAIAKVMIYNPYGALTNEFINNTLGKTDPYTTTPSQHQASYALNQGLTRWLAGEPVTGDDLVKGEARLDEALQNRNGLELFCRRTENFHSWWKAEGVNV